MLKRYFISKRVVYCTSQAESVSHIFKLLSISITHKIK